MKPLSEVVPGLLVIQIQIRAVWSVYQDRTDCQYPILSHPIRNEVPVIFLVTQKQIGPILADIFCCGFKILAALLSWIRQKYLIFAIDLVTEYRDSKPNDNWTSHSFGKPKKRNYLRAPNISEEQCTSFAKTMNFIAAIVFALLWKDNFLSWRTILHTGGPLFVSYFPWDAGLASTKQWHFIDKII